MSTSTRNVRGCSPGTVYAQSISLSDTAGGPVFVNGQFQPVRLACPPHYGFVRHPPASPAPGPGSGAVPTAVTDWASPVSRVGPVFPEFVGESVPAHGAFPFLVQVHSSSPRSPWSHIGG